MDIGLLIGMAAVTVFWLAIGGGNLKGEGGPK